MSHIGDMSRAARMEYLRAVLLGRRLNREPGPVPPSPAECWCCGARCPVYSCEPPLIWKCRACQVTWMALDWIGEDWQGVRYGPGPHP